MLQQDDLLPFDNDDAIPAEYVQPMIMLTAAAVSPAYKLPSDFPGTFRLVKSMIRNINQDFTASSTTQFSDF